MNTAQKIDIGSSTILRTILILLGVWFLYLIRDILLILVSAVVIAAAIEPVARGLRRYGVPRGLSVVIVYVAVIAILVLAVVLIVPAIVEQATQLVQSLPQLLRGLEERFHIGLLIPSDIPAQIEESLQRFGNNAASLGLDVFQRTANVFSGLVSLIFVFIIALYLVIEENALKKFFRIVVPRAHLAYIERIIDRAEEKIGRWVLAQLSLGLIIGLIVGFGLWLMGVPHAAILGLIAGLLEIIPVIGPIIAGIFGTLIALSQSLLLGVAAAVFYIVVQQIENHVLIPNIMKKATGLNPLVTLVAVLLGGRLVGVVGVILAVPVATIISIFISDFFTKASDKELAG